MHVLYIAGFLKLSLTMYFFSILIDEHVPLKFLNDKKAEENIKNIFYQ